MTILGIRFCHVADPQDAQGIAEVLGDGLAFPQLEMTVPAGDFQGAVFPASDSSWFEVWPASADMPAGTMVQIVVDDAEAYADNARAKGLSPMGPIDVHNERIYYMTLPGGLQMSFQSAANPAN